MQKQPQHYVEIDKYLMCVLIIMNIPNNEKNYSFAYALKTVTVLEDYARRVGFSKMLEGLVALWTVLEAKVLYTKRLKKLLIFFGKKYIIIMCFY